MAKPTLKQIPRKFRIALLRLRETGLLEEAIYETVLAAATHSPHPYLALEFAVAATHMQQAGLAIPDAVRMRIAEGLPVNLRWSARRWRTYHDAAARRLAVRTLAAREDALVPFDTTWLEARLPVSRGCVQVIKQPLRLAKESLRQRHCIISYEPRLRNGDLGALSIIYDHRRWTATILRPPPTDDGPAVVDCVRGKLNVEPSGQELAAILKRLGPCFTKSRPRRPPAVREYRAAADPQPAAATYLLPRGRMLLW